MTVTTSKFLERGNPEIQDRLEILQFGDRMVLVVADGSGGRSGAAQAAEFVIRSVRDVAEKLIEAGTCFRLLREVDEKIAKEKDCGETTGVVVVLTPGEIFGASVGDSAAWFFTADRNEELTRVRKPYLGTGVATPHQFSRKVSGGTVVVASDGLWKYTSLELIEQTVRAGNPEHLAADLAELVRLRSGAFQDDIAVATCRINK